MAPSRPRTGGRAYAARVADPGLRMGTAAGRWVLLTAVLGTGLVMLDATVVNLSLIHI